MSVSKKSSFAAEKLDDLLPSLRCPPHREPSKSIGGWNRSPRRRICEHGCPRSRFWDLGNHEPSASGRRAIGPTAEPPLSEVERWFADNYHPGADNGRMNHGQRPLFRRLVARFRCCDLGNIRNAVQYGRAFLLQV